MAAPALRLRATRDDGVGCRQQAAVEDAQQAAQNDELHDPANKRLRNIEQPGAEGHRDQHPAVAEAIAEPAEDD